MSRAPSTPPQLTGYTYQRFLGGGGFADVFLYEQTALKRQVAVKVLLESESNVEVRLRFESEGRLMAMLSEEHQNIVPVYDAAIGPDGRPYLVMQYCPLDDLSLRYKRAAFEVREVLSIGVELCGAVESAHRLGILHRDIKPANVLTRRSGKPALSDFGIAVTTSAAADPEQVAVSIPWSPPELVSDQPAGDVRSDVYSLTATLYTLLARRSPFEMPGLSNRITDLVHRINRLSVAPTGHPQSTRSLERLLAKGLAKAPLQRFGSAAELGHELQYIQRELGLPVTAIDIAAADPAAILADLPQDQADHTRIRPIIIRAQAPPTPGIHPPIGRPPAAATPRPWGSANRGVAVHGANHPAADDLLPVHGERSAWTGPSEITQRVDGSVERQGLAVGVERTMLRGRPSTGSYLDAPPQGVSSDALPEVPVIDDIPPRRSRRALAGWALAAGVVVAAAIVAVVLGESPPAPPPTPPQGPTTGDVVPGLVAAPSQVTGTAVDGGAVFTWAVPTSQSGDSYGWTQADVPTDTPALSGVVQSPAVTVTGMPTGCITVQVFREDGTSSSESRGCTS